MSKSTSKLINSLVDKTESLGAGLVDSDGFLVHSSGYHANKDKDELAVYLLAMSPKNLNTSLDDEVYEYIILAKEYKIYCYWLDKGNYLLYVLCKNDANGKLVRTNLHSAARSLEQDLIGASVAAVSQRLEQPRHMSGDRWPAQDFESILK